jgi:hypothetical protein
MINYSTYPTASAIPEASSMIENFRAIGYSIEAAIADITDNSISADAKNIWIEFEWKGVETWLSIKDDGVGMNNGELIQAMRPGSKHPLEDRTSKDLGRFGLGLKTASFSQCRKLTVVSKKQTLDTVYWTWDLDFVNQTGEWNLIQYLPDERYKQEISSFQSGTIVIWNDIDRLVKDFRENDQRALDKFLATMEHVKKHLAMTFHRFIDSGAVNIWFQNRKIRAWDPFLISESATQGFPDEHLQNGKVLVKGYVLPHKSRITEEVYLHAVGLRGWNEHQGFYIYRNERLIVAGDWLGLYRKEERYRLARIRIDLPNSLDTEWQIDIKKSIARPPLSLREQLKAYSGLVRNQAVEVYKHRGKSVRQLPGQKFVPLWLDRKRGDKWFYSINREHPVIENILTLAGSQPQKAIETLLRFIEETIPAKSIYIREASDEDTLGEPFENIDQAPIIKVAGQMYTRLIHEGKTDEQAKAIILNIEPFNHFYHLAELINNEL